MTVESTPVKANDWRNSKLLLSLLVAVLVGLMFFGNLRFGAYLGDWYNSDMMVIWLGSKGLLEGVDIYDVAVWEQLHADTGSEYRDYEIFLYPFPAVFVFAPLALLPIDISGALWLLALELMYIFCVWWFLTRIPTARKLSRFLVLALAVAVFPPFFLILWFVQYGVAMLFFLVVAVALFEMDRPETDFLGAMYVPLLLFRPNPIVALIPAIGLWLLWRRRWWAIAGGIVSGLLLLGVGWLVRPNWVQIWLDFALERGGRTETHGALTSTVYGMLTWMFPDLSGMGMTITLTVINVTIVGVALWALWRARDFSLPAVVALFSCVSLLVTPYSFQYDHILILFTVLWLLERAEGSAPRTRDLAWWVGLLTLLVPTLLVKLLIADLELEYRAEVLVPLVAYGVAIWGLLALKPRLPEPVSH